MSKEERIAVVLCGGLGSRMGVLTQALPKPLIEVRGKPILFYIIDELLKNDINKIIFPLGYLGGLIKTAVSSHYTDIKEKFIFIDTGESSPIQKRISLISYLIPDKADFLILNSDTIFDFDISKLMREHRDNESWLTLISVEITSPWGLIHTKNGIVQKFTRERRISNLISGDSPEDIGHINSGISVINKAALELVDLNSCIDFEQDLYTEVINQGKANLTRLNGTWFPIDTPKDLSNIESLFSEIN